jgi:T5SS/PEP-CTERM-associated repeat protein
MDVDAASPFTTTKPMLINARGVLEVTNSTLILGDRIDVSGQLTLDSGLIDTAQSLWDVRVGRIAGLTGLVELNGGVLDCFGFRVGELNGSSGLCNVNGGVLLSSSVLTIGEVFNSPGTVNLFSGTVIATNDLTKVGNLAYGEFNQKAGTSDLAFLSIGDNMPGTVNLSGGQMTVTPGAPTDIVRVGNLGKGQLNISGGVAQFKGEFHVADNLGVNGVVLLSGGELISTNGLVAIGRYGIGEVTVTNANAWFTNTSVGRHTDANGTLTVQTDGAVFCVDDLSIGRFTNAVGLVSVASGLLSLTNDNIWVGREGIGTLNVTGGGVVRARSLWVGMSPDGTNAPQGTATIDGGTVTLRSNLVVGTALVSTGQVSVLSGTLDITNSNGTGFLDVISGTFALGQGTVRADRTTVTNSAGQITFNGGTLETRDLTVANGSPFVVGDGINQATLRLTGGTATFADGLVISANATVTGCGAILGTIVNNGTLSTNCGPVLAIQSITKAGTTVTVSFTTLTGLNHVLEFKDTLADPSWSAVLPGVIGNGGLTNAQDTTATNRTRFYRIHAQ